MGIKQKATPASDAGQLRAAAGASGKNATKSFAAVDPVQKKDNPIQRATPEEEKLSMSSDPAQMAGGPLEEELK